MAKTNGFEICTFNCNGLNDTKKRQDVFNYLRNLECNIYCLQETHWKTDSEKFIRAAWGYNVWISGLDTNKNGVAILFNNNFEYKVLNIVRDPHGCYIVMDVEFLQKRITLINLYGPSAGDYPGFFDKICEFVKNSHSEHIILTGDWNCTLDMKIDCRNYSSNVNRPRTRKKILDMLEQNDLFDVFRELYPNKRLYTWRKFNTIKQSRLDYFILSETMKNETQDVKTLPGYRSDHSPVILILKMEQFHRDRPFWKFNNTLLKDKEYVLEIKNIINKIKQQYAVLVYDFNNLNQIPLGDLQFVISDQLFFEILLLEIRGKTISYAVHRKKCKLQEELNLEKEINLLETNLLEDNILKLESLKIKLENIRKEKLEGIATRSKARWISEGEKPTRYFCNLENRNFMDKSLLVLEKDNGEIITNQKEILAEVHKFYSNLYSSNDVEDIDLKQDLPNVPILTDEDRLITEGPITYEEAVKALRNMKNNKSPGPDGFTVEFFKFFFSDIGIFYVRSINEGFVAELLSITQRQGYIVCIPKEGKSKRFVQNWRPISLLNITYKIASSCIACRLKKILPKIIHENQKGFLKGRNIGEHIRMLYDTLVYAEKENIPGLILSVDMEKAFDSISWSFLFKCLDFFQFGPDFVKWIKTFYSSISTCLALNGQYSEWFSIKRGVRQGDPCSPYLYLIGAEILSLMLRRSTIIKGIKINNKENLLSQFADDTTICLDGSESSFEEAVRILLLFSKISGLKINFGKSHAVWIGSRKNCGVRYTRDKNFIWDPGIFKILGIIFSTDIDNIVNLNFGDKLKEIKKNIRSWNRRQLTPFGRITVIKTLLLSKIVHLLINLPDPSEAFLSALETELHNFLWANKRSKIKKSIIYKPYDEGGLNMPNVRHFLSSMKISWIKRLKENTSWKDFTIAMFPDFENIYNFGAEYATVVTKRLYNPFWKDVFKHYKKLSLKCNPTNAGEFLSECIHYNNNITRDSKFIFIKEWCNNKIFRVENLLNNDGNFMSFNQFKMKYPGLTTNFLLYQGVTRAIHRYQTKVAIKINDTNQDNIIKSKLWFWISKGSKCIQNILCYNDILPTAVQKWNNNFIDLNWKHIFPQCFKVTQDTQLRWFQYRILNRILPTQKYLYLCKILDSPLCNFCNNEAQTIEHLLYECPPVTKFWSDFQKQVIEKCHHVTNLKLDKALILFGVKEGVKTDVVFDFLILFAKYFIYKCKLEDSTPYFDRFALVLNYRFNIDKYNAYIDGRNMKFYNNWKQYFHCIL